MPGRIEGLVSAFFIHWNCGMASTAAMEAGPASVERLLAAAAATMEKARYCWAMTVAEDGSVIQEAISFARVSSFIINRIIRPAGYWVDAIERVIGAVPDGR